MTKKVSVVIWHGERNSSIASWVLSGFSSDSVGSHAALIVWDDTGEFPVDYLSFYSGKNDINNADGTKTQCCPNKNHHTTHLHSMPNDGFVEEDDGTQTAPNDATVIDLEHDSFNVESVRRYIKQLRSSFGCWGFQKNCSDTVLEALRAGLTISSYSWPLYSNEFGTFFTILISSLAYSNSNFVHKYMFMQNLYRSKLYCKEHKLKQELYDESVSHFMQVVYACKGAIVKFMAHIYDKYKGNIADAIKHNSLDYMMTKYNLTIPDTIDKSWFVLIIWNNYENIRKYKDFKNKPLNRVFYGLPYVLFLTSLYTSFLNRKLGFLSGYNLITMPMNILKIGLILSLAEYFSLNGNSYLRNALEGVGMVYNESHYGINNLFGLTSRESRIRNLSYSSFLISSFALLSGSVYLFKDMGIRDLLQIATCSVPIASAAKRLFGQVKDGDSVPVFSILHVIETSIPLMALTLLTNYAQRLATPAYVGSLAQTLQQQENAEANHQLSDTQKICRFMPSKSNLFYGSLKAASLLTLGLAMKKYWQPHHRVNTP